MDVKALDEMEKRLDDVLERLARADDGTRRMADLSAAIRQLAQCVRILHFRTKGVGTLHKIAERLETMEG